MAAIKFNGNKPSGIGVETATGERWITQGGWKFDPVTKELLPGQAPEPSLAPPDFSKPGGIEIPPLPEGTVPAGVTGSPTSPAPAVTPGPGELFDITMPVEEKPLQEGSDPVDSHPVVAPAVTPTAGPVPGKKSNRKG